MESFAAAAEAIKEKSMAVEDRVTKWLRRWMQDWQEDLEGRPEDIKTTAAGAPCGRAGVGGHDWVEVGGGGGPVFACFWEG